MFGVLLKGHNTFFISDFYENFATDNSPNFDLLTYSCTVYVSDDLDVKKVVEGCVAVSILEDLADIAKPEVLDKNKQITADMMMEMV